jgi:GntR family transcriptional regulator
MPDQDAPAQESRPLYTQVRDTLFERIRSGALKPGEELGSEFALAAELGVSQGTVRKALEVLRGEKLLVRMQGRGTFVSEQTPAGVLFRFFNIYTEAGIQVLPDSRDVTVRTGAATKLEQSRLGLASDARVLRIARVRTHEGRPFIAETIVLPAGLFPGLENLRPMPNTLYDLFQRSFGITVSHTQEQVTVVPAAVRAAAALTLDLGQPLLAIDRTTYSLGNRIVEWRLSHCHLVGCHYRVQLR